MIRRLVVFSFALAIFLVAGPARAQQLVPARDRGAIQLGVRVGYGVPSGKTGNVNGSADDELSRTIKGQIPIGIDAGYLITPTVYVGLSLQYGFGFVGSSGDATCNRTGVSCSTSDTTLGLDAHFHLKPAASFDPWIGLGVGYEWLDVSISSANATESATVKGFEYAKVQLGGDVSVVPGLAVGPFLSLAAGQYSSFSQTGPAVPMSQDITSKSFHEWLLFGVRGVYNIRL